MPDMGTGYAVDQRNAGISPRSPTAIENAREIISQIRGQVQSIADRVSLLADHLNGPRPPEKTGLEQSSSVGNSLFNVIGDLQTSIGRLDREVGRLDNMG